MRGRVYKAVEGEGEGKGRRDVAVSRGSVVVSIASINVKRCRRM